MRKLLDEIVTFRFQKKLFKQFIKPFSKKYKHSWSQCGEDMILDVIFGKKNGIYVDVGANNPEQQSNTMYFYKKGWNGINIDPTPGSMKAFNRKRRRDINLEVAVSNEEKELVLYLFKPSFYNTFEERISVEYKHLLIGSKVVKTSTLARILDQYLKGDEIDFLTIDVEGLDYDILKSNDWTRYRPKVVVIEFITYSGNTGTTSIGEFLTGTGYKLFCNTPTNAIFIENSFFEKRFGGVN